MKMELEIMEVVDILESLLEDTSAKVRVEIEAAISLLNSAKDAEDLLAVQDQLEIISNMSNVDSYTRNEIFNVSSLIESLL